MSEANVGILPVGRLFEPDTGSQISYIRTNANNFYYFESCFARQMYRSFGFEETGEMDGEELIAVLRL